MAIDWDDLRYLLAVQRAGTLIAAARALDVDKATVSRRIAALEEGLGARLFDRKPDGYGITPPGEQVLAAAAEVDQTIAALLTRLGDQRGDTTGVVHLTVPQFFASRILLPALPGFRARYPGIELVVNASSSVLNIAQREAEVGLRNAKPDQASVAVKRVGSLGSALYASRSYLGRRGTPTAPEQVGQHDLVAWDRAFTFVKPFTWIEGSGARIAVRVNDAAVLAEAVAAGVGLGVLPRLLGDEHAELVRLDAFGRASDEIYAVAAGELRRSGRVRAVIELLGAVWAENAERLAGRSVEGD